MAYIFDNGSKYLARGSDGYSGINAQSFTIVCWFRSTIGTCASEATIMSLSGATNSETNCAKLTIKTTVKPAARLLMSGDSAPSPGGTITAWSTPDTWYMAAGVWTFSSPNYISGYTKAWPGSGTSIESYTGTWTNQTQAAITDNISFASRYAGLMSQALYGMGAGTHYLAEASVWTKALSDAELLELTTKKASALSAYSSDCKNYWPLYDNLNDSKGSDHLTAYASATYTTGVHPTLSDGASAVVSKLALLGVG